MAAEHQFEADIDLTSGIIKVRPSGSRTQTEKQLVVSKTQEVKLAPSLDDVSPAIIESFAALVIYELMETKPEIVEVSSAFSLEKSVDVEFDPGAVCENLNEMNIRRKDVQSAIFDLFGGNQIGDLPVGETIKGQINSLFDEWWPEETENNT